MLKKELKHRILNECSFNLEKTKEGLLFESKRKNNNNAFKIIMTISFVILLCILPVIFLSKNGNNDNQIPNNNVPPVSFLIPTLPFAHVKIVEVDSRDLYYHYSNISFEGKVMKLPVKLLTFHIEELYNKDEVIFYNNTFREGDNINIAIPLELYDKLKEYDEFIISISNYGYRDLYTNNNERIISIHMYQTLYKKGSNDLIPIKNNNISIQELIDNGDMSHHILLEGNRLIDDPSYYCKDGATIDDLRKYFEIIRKRMKLLNQEG